MATHTDLYNVKSTLRMCFAMGLITLLSLVARAQTAARPDRGMMPAGSYAVSDIENVNLTNGNVNLSIPLAALPPMAGGKLSMALRAVYNSKLWDAFSTERAANPPLSGYTESTAQLSNSGGWQVGGIYFLSLHSVNEDYAGIIPSDPGDPDSTLLRQYVWKMVLTTPDGANHELRPMDYSSYPGSQDWARGYYKDTPRADSVKAMMRYYSFDGSYIYATIDPFPIGSYPTNWVVYLPDGTRITYNNGLERIRDNNGNKIKIFSDASGSLSTTHYQDELTGREIKNVYNSSTNTSQVQYQTVGGTWVSIDINRGTTHVRGRTYGIGDPCQSEGLIDTDINVIRSIVLPQSDAGSRQQFTFSYNSDITDTVNIQWKPPGCGGTSTITQASRGLGSLSQMVMPTGATVSYTYQYDGYHPSYPTPLQANDVPEETITQKAILHDATTDTWTYSIGLASAEVIGPDGSDTTETFYAHNPGVSSYVGADKAGLVYRMNQSGKVLVERQWTKLIFSGGNNTGPGGLASFNAVVTAEFTSMLDSSGNPATMSARTMQYDYNGNLTQESDYDWFDPAWVAGNRDAQGVPTVVPGSATLLRTVTTSYYNPAMTANSANVYAKRLLPSVTPLIVSAAREMIVGASDTQFTYDGLAFGNPPTAGNLTTQRRWDNRASRWLVTTYGYDSYGNRTSITDPKNNVTTLAYDALTHAQPTTVTVDPLNGTGAQTASTAYDYSTGVVTSQTDINGKTITYSYTNQLTLATDVYARPALVTAPAVTAVIDGVSSANQQRQVVSKYYDNARQVETISDLKQQGDRLLKRLTTADNLGRVIRIEQSEDGSSYTLHTRTAYQQMGRIIFVSNPTRDSGESTDGWSRTTRDALGRVTEVASFDGATQPTATATNWNGRVQTSYDTIYTTVTDQAGKVRRSVTDGLGRLARIDEPDINGSLGPVIAPSQATAYSYDVLGNLTGVSQGSQLRQFTYDSLSRLREAYNPEQVNTSNQQVATVYSYDDNSNLQQKTNPNGSTVSYSYDGLNRMTSKTLSTGGVWTYSYDTLAGTGKGRLTSVVQQGSTDGYYYDGYDTLGRVTSSHQITSTPQAGAVSYQISYGYDLAGTLTRESYPSGRVVLTGTDAAGRIAGVKDQAAAGYYVGGAASDAANRLGYAAQGAVSVMRLGNGKWEHTNYNSRLQPTQIGLGTSSTDSSLLKLDYGYGTTSNNGNLLSQTITIGATVMSQSYGYDTLNRLQSATESGAWSQSYAYDRYGNRAVTSSSGYPLNPLTPTTLSAYNASTNRLTANGYDVAGNQTQEGVGRMFTYDAENRQLTFNATAGQYAYDGDGRRVKKIDSTGTTVFVYDAGGKMIAEYTSGNPSSNGTSYLTSDTLGSMRVVTKSDGTVKARYDYLPFGEELGAGIGQRTQAMGYSSGDLTRQKFTSKERDNESGLDYFGARYYSAAQGRFTSVDLFDPVLGKQGADDKEKAEKEFRKYLGQPQHWNRYPYALNNPLRYVDPDGFGETVVVALTIVWDKDAHYTDEEKEEIKRRYIAEAKETFKNIDITFVVVSEGEGTATNLANDRRTVKGYDENNLNVFFTKKSDLPSTEVTRYDQGTVFIRTHGINFVNGAFQPEYHETDLPHGIIHAFGIAGDVYPSGSLGAELDTSTTRFLLRLGNNPGYEDDPSKRSKILGPKVTNVLRDGARKYAIGAKKP